MTPLMRHPLPMLPPALLSGMATLWLAPCWLAWAHLHEELHDDHARHLDREVARECKQPNHRQVHLLDGVSEGGESVRGAGLTSARTGHGRQLSYAAGAAHPPPRMH